MNFSSQDLPELLQPYVKHLFHYENFQPDHNIERVIPTGEVFLIFELDGITRHTYDNKTLEVNSTFNKVWISGTQKSFITISAHEDSEMLVVQFEAGGALPFIHTSLNEFHNEIIPAEQILGEEILELHADMMKGKNGYVKMDIAESWLVERYKPELNPPKYLLEIFERLRDTPEREMNELLESYPHTQKHLIAQFKKYLGLTPKAYHRILRFNRLLQSLQNQQNINWTEVAHEFGYSDQSHFIKEFQTFSGFNPSEFINNDYQNDEPNF
ncbi:AraC family transcriptional regulator, partial [bacterium]|nr:AraC family transcriptional regulator [bacterium]